MVVVTASGAKHKMTKRTARKLGDVVETWDQSVPNSHGCAG